LRLLGGGGSTQQGNRQQGNKSSEAAEEAVNCVLSPVGWHLLINSLPSV
jgi:hypothetical protein